MGKNIKGLIDAEIIKKSFELKQKLFPWWAFTRSSFHFKYYVLMTSVNINKLDIYSSQVRATVKIKNLLMCCVKLPETYEMKLKFTFIASASYLSSHDLRSCPPNCGDKVFLQSANEREKVHDVDADKSPGIVNETLSVEEW